MTRGYFILAVITLVLSSCSIDEQIWPMVGVYRAHVVGVAGPFDLVISTQRGDNLYIEAPFDGFNWGVIKVDTDDTSEWSRDIDISSQDLYNDAIIKGDGFYFDGTLELKYKIRKNGDNTYYTLVATKI